MPAPAVPATVKNRRRENRDRNNSSSLLMSPACPTPVAVPRRDREHPTNTIGGQGAGAPFVLGAVAALVRAHWNPLHR